jgi:hypothetical protein
MADEQQMVLVAKLTDQVSDKLKEIQKNSLQIDTPDPRSIAPRLDTT